MQIANILRFVLDYIMGGPLLLLAAPAVCRVLAAVKHPIKRYESRRILAPLYIVMVPSNVLLLLQPDSCPWPRPPPPPPHPAPTVLPVDRLCHWISNCCWRTAEAHKRNLRV